MRIEKTLRPYIRALRPRSSKDDSAVFQTSFYKAPYVKWSVQTILKGEKFLKPLENFGKIWYTLFIEMQGKKGGGNANGKAGGKV